MRRGKTADLDDEALLDLVQRQTFRYFWDFAHPVSGLARERSNVTAEVRPRGGHDRRLAASASWRSSSPSRAAGSPATRRVDRLWTHGRASCSGPTAITASCRTS